MKINDDDDNDDDDDDNDVAFKLYFLTLTTFVSFCELGQLIMQAKENNEEAINDE